MTEQPQSSDPNTRAITDTEIRLLRLRSAGMFSNVNEVIEQLRRSKVNNYRFAIDWATSCYRDPDHLGDPWAYYFEPCFEGLSLAAIIDADPTLLLGGPPVACARDNIITPRLRDGDCNPLLLPKDRQGAHRLITEHLILKPAVIRKIEAFRASHFKAAMIGLHIRGPGRTDGGVPTLRQSHSPAGEVPLKLYFDYLDLALHSRPGADIFACSDSSAVIAAVQQRYGARVVTYDATRSTFGEMHANHPKNNGQHFPAHKLGLDILMDAYLLAETDFLVHGNSNVANFVLCKSPNLPHAYAYA